MSDKLEHAHTREELKAYQALPLSVKISLSQDRIRDWYKEFNGQVYIAFSGGKDSTVLLHLVRELYPDVEAVFVDTGLEYPELRQFVKTIDNVTWLKPKMNFREVILNYGYPIISKEVSQRIYEYRKNPSGFAANRFDMNSERNQKYNGRYCLARYIPLRDSTIPVSHMCCNIMKKTPDKQFAKRTGKYKIIGTMAEESALRTTDWLRHGCNVLDTTVPQSKPLSFWTEQDVLHYLKEYNIPYASVYGDIIPADDNVSFEPKEQQKLKTTGCHRTGCVFCGFGCHLEKEPNRFQRLKETHPKIYNYCMKPIEKGGLGMDEVLNFINVPH